LGRENIGMLTVEENDRLTRVGPGTPMGELQRRYWHPIGAVEELETAFTKRVRLLGEDLVLYRDRNGKLGLIAEFCPHRHASLANGIPDVDGIRCSYHGWKFNGAGACVDQPNEPAESTFKDKVRIAGYPVEALGGMIFAYLGPLPAPQLPHWDGFDNPTAIRTIGWAHVACNWLQIMENSLDPVHTEWQHGKFQEFVEEQRGTSYQISRHHLKIDFAEFELGIYKRRLLEGASEQSDDWKVGHPVLFPNILAVGSGGGKLWKMQTYQMRVPIDDENSMHYWYSSYDAPGDLDVPAKLRERIPFYEVRYLDDNGGNITDNIDAQDVMAWLSQGRIYQRSNEALGMTDRGIIMFRKMLERELKKVEAGQDPMNVFRTADTKPLEFHLERDKAHFTDGFENLQYRQYARWSPFFRELCDLFAAYNEKRLREAMPAFPLEHGAATTGE
jgi:5,5'-dehydrodivanillate O-demethylase oxygenase subunit